MRHRFARRLARGVVERFANNFDCFGWRKGKRVTGAPAAHGGQDEEGTIGLPTLSLPSRDSEPGRPLSALTR